MTRPVARRRGGRVAAVLGAALAMLALSAIAAWLALRPGAAPPPSAAERAAAPDPAAIARGARVAQAGHCAGCHGSPGAPGAAGAARAAESAPLAGGRVLATPFGGVVAPNLTPDPATGLGGWSAAAFARALRQGIAADGRWIVPVCPWPNYAHVADDDVADLHAWLRSLAPVVAPRAPHTLRWPYGTPVAQGLWRVLHAPRVAAPAQAPVGEGPERGAYLVHGLGHCSACHGRRDAWGATAGPADLRGGVMPGSGWWAPALDAAHQGGLAGWPLDEAVALLQTGQSPRAGTSGPMALVVKGSLQHLPVGDLRAIVRHLQALPQPPVLLPSPRPAPEVAPELQALGAQVYAGHCARCHGAQGEGVALPDLAEHPGGGRLPALAGNRAVVMDPPVNVIKAVLGGGYGPATARHPRPEGMPPYATLLSDAEVAAVVTHLRTSWGHRATPVGVVEVGRQRGSGLH